MYGLKQFFFYFFQEYKYILICCEGSEIFKLIDNLFFLVLFKDCNVIAQHNNVIKINVLISSADNFINE